MTIKGIKTDKQKANKQPKKKQKVDLRQMVKVKSDKLKQKQRNKHTDVHTHEPKQTKGKYKRVTQQAKETGNNISQLKTKLIKAQN